MRVMVTGGAGYIGCLVVEELLKNNYTPVVFDTFYWGKESLAPFLDNIELIEGDCRNSKDIIYALEGVDAIIHLAGIVGEFACNNYPKAHFSINVESTRTLVNCCTDPELDLVRDFIFASSCSVYGNVQGLYEEVTEETPTAPLSGYAQAKLRSEQIILDRANTVPHFHPTILRLTTVFGWSPRPRLDLVTNLFAYKAWKDGKISIHGDGQQYRSLIHVKDVARALVKTLDTPRFIRSGKIFHLGEKSNNKTVGEIAEIVQSILPQTQIEYAKDKPTDRRDYRINCQKLNNIIGWKADFSVEDGIKELVQKFETLDWNWDADKYRNSSFQYK
ncbi:NAD-dependent epimerase/dehydratase family protein [Thermodesulfobacteriota bacterium]